MVHPALKTFKKRPLTANGQYPDGAPKYKVCASTTNHPVTHTARRVARSTNCKQLPSGVVSRCVCVLLPPANLIGAAAEFRLFARRMVRSRPKCEAVQGKSAASRALLWVAVSQWLQVVPCCCWLSHSCCAGRTAPVRWVALPAATEADCSREPLSSDQANHRLQGGALLLLMLLLYEVGTVVVVV